MIKLCVFDMDGLLLDSERLMYLKAGIDTSNALNRPIPAEFFTSLMGGSWEAYEQAILDNFGADYPMDEYWKMYDKIIDDTIESGKMPTRPGVMNLLNYCKDKGIKMAIATSTNHHDAIKMLTNTNLIDYFEFIMTGDRVKETKPNPEIFLKAIEHFEGIDKSEAMVFEDGHNGALAAKNGGCRLTLVEDLAMLTKEDKEYADHVTDNISTFIEFIERENERTTGV